MSRVERHDGEHEVGQDDGPAPRRHARTGSELGAGAPDQGLIVEARPDYWATVSAGVCNRRAWSGFRRRRRIVAA